MSESPPPRFGRDLTTGSIFRQMVAFSLPMLAGSVLMMAYSFVNAIWVGQFLGKTALAAVTVSFPIFIGLISLGGGLTMAANILVAQHVGAGRRDEMGRVVDSSTVLVAVVGAILFVIGEILAGRILRAMNTPPDVLAAATAYMRVFLLAQPFGFGVFLMRNLLQGIGDSTTPLKFMCASIGLNVILDPVLMLGWLGVPRLGLPGEAWASVICESSALLVLSVYLHRRRNPVAPRWGQLDIHLPTIWSLFRIGIPAAVQQSLVSLAMLCVITMVNGFGETATAAFGAATRLEQLVLVPCMVFGMSISTIAGQNIGANKPQRVKLVFVRGSLLSGGVTVLVSLVVLAFPQALLRIFIRDPEVIRLGTGYLRIVAPFYICFALMFVSNGIINGSGHTSVTTIIAVVSQLLVRVSVAWILINTWHAVTGIWVAIAASFVVSMLASVAYYSSGRWKRAVTGLPPRPVET